MEGGREGWGIGMGSTVYSMTESSLKWITPILLQISEFRPLEEMNTHTDRCHHLVIGPIARNEVRRRCLVRLRN